MMNAMRNHMDDKRLRGAEKKMRGHVCMRESTTITRATEAFCKYLKDDPAASGNRQAKRLRLPCPSPGPAPARTARRVTRKRAQRFFRREQPE
jgi:hypothetical protein